MQGARGGSLPSREVCASGRMRQSSHEGQREGADCLYSPAPEVDGPLGGRFGSQEGSAVGRAGGGPAGRPLLPPSFTVFCRSARRERA